jgi:DNA helicase-2/ATP-dependent DNA helicase PcrA
MTSLTAADGGHNTQRQKTADLGFTHLNEAQKRAVIFDPEAALMVIAGPGSGKTLTIVERVRYLVSSPNQGINPSWFWHY